VGDQLDDMMVEARKFEKNLLNFFWRQGVSYSEGEDLVQETYLRLWKYRLQYEPAAKLSTFLFLIARQVRIDALRRQSRREMREDRWGKDQGDIQMPADQMVGEDVRWAVARLTEPLREVVELGVFQDLPYAQVSEILGIPVGTVKSRMSNALKKLKEIFDEQGS
jgi:RNA polymerase sigma-70 factor (ECF subfamily)